MFMSEDLKRPVWVASGTMTDGVLQFGTPVLYDWNWRGLSSSVEMMTFGPKYLDYRRTVTTNEQIENIKRLDRVWLEITPSDPTDPLASDANFYILSADPGPGGSAVVTFKRVSSDA